MWYLNITRYPQEVSPWLNLTKLMTPTSWSWTFVSLISIVLYFNCTTFLVKKWMDGKIITREIALYPFRFKACWQVYVKYLHLWLTFYRINYPVDNNGQPTSRRTSTSKKTSLRSFNFLFSLWAVCGQFIQFFLLCDYLTVLVKPVFEDPVNSAQVMLNTKASKIDWFTFTGCLWQRNQTLHATIHWEPKSIIIRNS